MVEWNNGTTTAKYAYIHNLQGDTVVLIDSTGTKVVSYTYDAWGKPLSTTGPLAATLGKLNPFRYRSYVYDEETGLYYLRSRYYNPEKNRFINSDVLFTLYRNQYQYCKNNPGVNIDISGYAPSNATPIPWYERFKNNDGSYSLHDSDRFHDNSSFHEQLFAVNIAPLDVDFIDGDITLLDTELDLITGGWETENFDFSLLDLGHAEASLDINLREMEISVGAIASVWSPSVSFNFLGCKITIGAEILSYGAQSDYSANGSSFSASVGFGLFGGTIAIEWGND